MKQKNRFKEGEAIWCADMVRKIRSKDTDHILHIAEDAVHLEFLFDLPWDMEQTTKKEKFSYPVNWTYMPGDDPEFIYQMNRHRYLICLGQAYALTGDEKYAETFVRILNDWMEHVPLTEESRNTTWRELEAGIRGENWTKAILYFEKSPALTDEFLERFSDSLRVHGEYLMSSERAFLISSNWGVIANCGLYRIGCALGEREYQEKALERLCRQARIQMFPDGVHWEQSCMYHNEVLHCFMSVLFMLFLSGEGNGQAGRCLADAVARMAKADVAWIKPDRTQPLMGDSDETGLEDILIPAAVLLYQAGYWEEAELLKGLGGLAPDFESIWDLRRAGTDIYARICGQYPEQKNYFLTDSGNYIVRTGWERDAGYLRFRNGCLGGGHGHNDRLHLDLVKNGEDILVDAGRYRYTWHRNGRVWFKSAEAHNTVLVDGKDYMDYPDPWAVRYAAPEIRMPVQERDGLIVMEGAHTGYLQNGFHVILHRTVIVLEEGVTVLADMAHTDERHTYSRLFHFNNSGNVICVDNKVRYKGKRAMAEMIFPDKDIKVSVIDSRISRHYNSKEKNQAVCAEVCAGGNRIMFTVIKTSDLPQNGCKNEISQIRAEKIPVENPVSGKVLSGTEADALKIWTDNRCYTIIIRTGDMTGPSDLLQAGDCMGMGRILIAREADDPLSFG